MIAENVIVAFIANKSCGLLLNCWTWSFVYAT